MELKIGYATLETKAFKLLEGKIANCSALV